MSRTGIFVHGLNVNEADWRERIFGVPPLKLGRASRAIQLLHAKYPEAALMLFGSGGSEREGLKEGDYTIRYMLGHFDELRDFKAFRDMRSWTFSRLKQQVARISKSELQSHNTLTELRFGIPQFSAAGIRNIVVVSDYPHFSRCAAHAGQIIEETGLEDSIEVTAEHSLYRHPGQMLSDVKVFEPETKPEDGIQLGDLASQLFKVRKGNRAAFKAEYEALIAKYQALQVSF